MADHAVPTWEQSLERRLVDLITMYREGISDHRMAEIFAVFAHELEPRAHALVRSSGVGDTMTGEVTRRDQAIKLLSHTAKFIRDRKMVSDGELAELLLTGFAELAGLAIAATGVEPTKESIAAFASSLISSGAVKG